MVDDPIVADGSVVVTPPEGETPSQAQLSKEQITQMVQEQVRLATESAKREIQSVKDKARQEVEQAQNRARMAESTLTNVGKNLGDLDPEIQTKVRLEQAEAQNAYYGQLARQQEQEQQRLTFDSTFRTNLSQHIQSLGIDPNDKEIDWAEDSQADYLTRQQRILASVAKVQGNVKKVAEAKEADMAKEIEARLRKDLGLDSHDVSTPAAMGKDFSKLSPADKIKAGIKEQSK